VANLRDFIKISSVNNIHSYDKLKGQNQLSVKFIKFVKYKDMARSMG